MRNGTRYAGRLLLWTALLFVPPLITRAQTSNVRPQISAAVDEARLTTLRGNTHPLARAEFDRGIAPSSLLMQRMLLVLKRSPEQETALAALLDQQQDKSSPNYHLWVTPEQFGQQFGPADQDIQAISSWLQAHGFQVAQVSKGRTVIEFSGTAGQVQEAFHTAIHRFNVNGEDHWANSSDPQIPLALAPVVVGVNTLHNFPRSSAHNITGTMTRSESTGQIQTADALFTLGGSCGVPGIGCHAVGPYDFAIIYNLLPLWNASPAIDGTGQIIAVVGESDINIQDIRDFRSYFGLSAKDPQIILDGTDPGFVSGDETESDLDVEWAGAVARNATIDLVISDTTEASLGVDLSAQYVVDNNLAPILSESYGFCELGLGTAGNQFYNQLWQQASAQGITVLVSSGDSGSAVCDSQNSQPPAPAKFGLQVNGFASTPYNVSVGGTDFNDLTNPLTYWAATNSAPPGSPSAPLTVSALSYIPETTWNSTCTNAVLGNPTFYSFSTNAETNCNNPQLINLVKTSAGSGGKSNCTSSVGQNPASCSGGYAKPSWQTALTPNDNKRDVPDVSLFAAVGSPSGSFYAVCEADQISAGNSSCKANDPNTHFLGIGGTSASVQVFAGIMALVDQKTGARQGNANYVLYKLASQQPSSFNDVSTGTIAMPCAKGSQNCTVTNSNDQYGVLSGYAATTGYDLAIGLGSVNANNLVGAWATAETNLKSTTTSLALNSGSTVNITHGQSVNVNIGVTSNAGAPTGNVSLIANTGSTAQESVQGFTLNGVGSVNSTTALLPGNPGGQPYTVFGRYSGDGTFGPSDSSPVSVTVSPEASSANIALEIFNPTTGLQTNPNTTTAQYGSLELLRMNVTSQSGDTCAQNASGQFGCPTGSVTITNNGVALDAGAYQINSQGYAEDQIVQLPGGTDTLKLTYGGDNSFLASNSTSLVTISKAPTALTINPIGNVTFGSVTNVNAGVASTGLGTGPTGQVTFFSGATPIGIPAIISATNGGTLSTNPGAFAGTFTSQLPLGNNSITAQYSGDGNYASSTSLPILVSVQIPTALSINASNTSIQHGSSVTFTAQITATQAGGPGPTGTVVFGYDFGTLGSVPLTNGTAQFTTSALPGGLFSVFATYSGDVDYVKSGKNLIETVNLLPTTTIVTASNPVTQQGSSVTLTGHVSPVQTGGPPLTGQIGFWYASSAQGTHFGIGSTVSLSNGQGQVTTSSLPPNIQLVGADYEGDDNYAISTGSTAQTVAPPPTFTVTANPTTININAPGQSGSTVLTFTSQNGFSGTVTLGAANCSGLPSQTSCSFNPSSINLSTTSTTATSTLTISTTAPSSAIRKFDVHPYGLNQWSTHGEITLAGLFCFGALATGFRWKQRRWRTGFAVLAFGLLIGSAACGGGGSTGGTGGSGSGGGITNPGTPTGQYVSSVTITINGITQTIPNLTVNIQ